MLVELNADATYPVNRLEHSLQCGTRALRDDRDEEFIVCCLLHDVGESLGPFNHGEVVAAILKPFISTENYWMPVFQLYFIGQHLGTDPNERDSFVSAGPGVDPAAVRAPAAW